jgi:hypothetical protein
MKKAQIAAIFCTLKTTKIIQAILPGLLMARNNYYHSGANG